MSMGISIEDCKPRLVSIVLLTGLNIAPTRRGVFQSL
jgi:hypothetical protein